MHYHLPVFLFCGIVTNWIIESSARILDGRVNLSILTEMTAEEIVLN